MALCLFFSVSFQGAFPHEMGRRLPQEEDAVDLRGIHVLGAFSWELRKDSHLMGFPLPSAKVL